MDCLFEHAVVLSLDGLSWVFSLQELKRVWFLVWGGAALGMVFGLVDGFRG